MSANLSKTSLDRLLTCHPDLQKLIKEAAEDSPFDFMVLYGARTKEEQELAFSQGHTKLKYPKSKHNITPERPQSLAVDIAPYPINWKDIAKFKLLADHIIKKAKELNIDIVWGGTFKSLVDMPHFELKNKGV